MPGVGQPWRICVVTISDIDVNFRLSGRRGVATDLPAPLLGPVPHLQLPVTLSPHTVAVLLLPEDGPLAHLPGPLPLEGLDHAEATEGDPAVRLLHQLDDRPAGAKHLLLAVDQPVPVVDDVVWRGADVHQTGGGEVVVKCWKMFG